MRAVRKLFIGALASSPVFGVCMPQAQVVLPDGEYVFPTSRDSMRYKSPEMDLSTQAIMEDRCATAGAKAVENYNSYLAALSRSTDTNIGGLGTSSFVRYVYCYRDVEDENKIVVNVVMASDRMRDTTEDEKTKHWGATVLTVFDLDLNIIEWTY